MRYRFAAEFSDISKAFNNLLLYLEKGVKMSNMRVVLCAVCLVGCLMMGSAMGAINYVDCRPYKHNNWRNFSDRQRQLHYYN